MPAATVSCRLDSPLGPMLLAATAQGLSGLWFEGQRHWPAQAAGWTEDRAHPAFRQARQWLEAYFGGAGPGALPPPPDLDLSAGTAFQQRVWRALRSIAHASTLSYRELALQAGAPGAARAVGAAVGRNPVSIIVPCHRVLGAGGALTGYAGGLERKKALLGLEGLAH